MLEESQIMPYNFFVYDGIYTGEHHGMKYLIRRTGEKPDYELQVEIWQGPFCSKAVSDDKKTVQKFKFSEGGRLEAIKWLERQYETRRAEWDAALSILEAEPELRSEEKKES